MMDTVPVIRIELQRAQYALNAIIQEAFLQRDEDVKRAIETALSPENIQRWLSDSVTTEIRKAIDQEIQSFYRYGAGREALKEMVVKRLMGEE